VKDLGNRHQLNVPTYPRLLRSSISNALTRPQNPGQAPRGREPFLGESPVFSPQSSGTAPAQISTVDERPPSDFLSISRERKQSFGFGTAIANPFLASQFVTDARTTGTIRNT